MYSLSFVCGWEVPYLASFFVQVCPSLYTSYILWGSWLFHFFDDILLSLLKKKKKNIGLILMIPSLVEFVD